MQHILTSLDLLRFCYRSGSRTHACQQLPLLSNTSLNLLERSAHRRLLQLSLVRPMSRSFFWNFSLRWGPSFQVLRISLAFWAAFMILWPAGVAQQTSTDPVELEALFEVMRSINSDTDWTTELPDPCLGSQQGIYCLAVDVTGMYHVTNLEFGYMTDYDNLISCSSNASFSPSIAKLQFLETLFIYNCFVNGSTSVPSEIGRLSNSLQMLTLQGNPSLGGFLPGELGNLTSLQRMVLTENSFEGPIPKEYGNLSNLVQLELSENRLNGTIPGALNSLESLVILDLSCNFLSGGLPSLDRLTRLQQLVLSNNNLNGSIPEDFGSLNSLTYLDLSQNNLSGGIPPSFENLKMLQDVFLEGNSMQSPLLDFVGRMVGLSRLSLAGSGFVGEIPESLGSLANLRVLLLQGNNFSGPIPPTLGKLPNIYQLDLSANRLTGPVPFSVAFVSKLGRNLVLSNNSGLCIPPANGREVVATLGVIISADCNQSSSHSGWDTTRSPNAAPEYRQLQLNYTSRRRQIPYTYLDAFSALALWMISSSFFWD